MICDVELGIADATRIHTVEVARGFVAEGLEVDLIARGPDPRIPGVRYLRAVGSDDQRVRRLASMYAQIVRVLIQRRGRFRRLYVRYNWTVVLSMLLGRMLGYRVVTQVDDVPFGRGYEPDIPVAVDYLKRTMAVLMGKLAHGVVAVTPEIKGLLVTQFRVPGRRVTVLRNGVDLEFFRPAPREAAQRRLGLEPDLSYLVFCGNFAWWVDFETILEAFAIVAGVRPDTRLVLVGDGGERGVMEQHVRRLGLQDRVIVTGFVQDRTQVRDYLTASVVAVAAHRPEYCARIGVSPTKVAEYLATGRAVVAADIPGLRETLEATGAGTVVPPRSAAAMGSAILDLLDPALADQYGERGRRVAEERFSWRTIVRRTLPLFGL
jgi:glycosyltransferase involved in cell wall biosynthesis